jgi:hypothetical protein
MDDNQLNEIATLLEVDAADAKTHIIRCKPQHLVGLTANRAGFLRLAASCLRAAAAPLIEGDCRSRPVHILEPHEQVVDNDSDCIICFLQRMEVWPEPKEFIKARTKRTLRNDRWALLTCAVVGFIVLFVIVAGITAIASWFR